MKSEEEVLEGLRFWQGQLAGMQIARSLSKEEVEKMEVQVKKNIEALIKKEIERLRRFLEMEKES